MCVSHSCKCKIVLRSKWSFADSPLLVPSWVDHASLTKHVCLWKDIVQLWQQGKTPAHIAWELRQDSIYTTSQTVQHCIFTSTKGESPKDWRRSEWPSTITKKIMADINRMLEQVDKFTFSKIHRIIVKRFTVWILTSTIWCFFRLKLKWIVVRARTAPLFLVRNKKHWEIAGKCISDKDTFDVVCIFDQSIKLNVITVCCLGKGWPEFLKKKQ